MVPGVTIYPNGKEMREIRSTSLISIPKGNSSHMVVMDLSLFQEYLNTLPYLKRVCVFLNGARPEESSWKSDPEQDFLFLAVLF